MAGSELRPIVLIPGATGNLGRSLVEALGRDYRIVGLGLKAEGADFPVLEADFTSDAAVELALRNFRDAFGSRIASVVHLVAYSDFTGEDHPRITAPAKLPTPILARLHADLVKWTKLVRESGAKLE